MAEHQVEIRRVKKDDYNKVVDMFPAGEIYSGFDYLPDFFHMLIGMQNVEAYAAIIDNKFTGEGKEKKPKELLILSGVPFLFKLYLIKVSFVFISLVDDGKTRVGRAGRTITQYERHGFMRRLTQCFEETSVQSRTNVYHASVTAKGKDAVERLIETGRRYKVLEREYRTYTGIITTEFRRKLYNQGAKTSHARLMNKTDLSELFCSEKMCHKFFPEGRVIVDWVPYRLMQSNAALIMTEKTTMVGENLHSHEQSLLTFMSCFRAHVGLVCTLDIYGKVGSTLNEHVFLHYKNMPLDEIPDKILFYCFYSDGIQLKLISSIMSGLGLDEHPDQDFSIICSERILYESSKL